MPSPSSSMKQRSGASSTTPVKKQVQFITQEPEFNIPTLPTNIVTRRQEEEIVLRRLRQKTGFGGEYDENGEPIGEILPLVAPPVLPQNLSRNNFCNENEKVTLDKDFILDCLCWHNEYRARHRAPALTLSQELCEKAQRWADKLAVTNEFYYKTDEKVLGQSLFCCPANNVLTDLTGQEVASYWYKEVKRYDYFKPSNLLHTSVNTGHFTQMVWAGSRYFGIGKSFSKTGKMFVVAYYFPAGNVVSRYKQNVLPPIFETDDMENNNCTKM